MKTQFSRDVANRQTERQSIDKRRVKHNLLGRGNNNGTFFDGQLNNVQVHCLGSNVETEILQKILSHLANFFSNV